MNAARPSALSGPEQHKQTGSNRLPVLNPEAQPLGAGSVLRALSVFLWLVAGLGAAILLLRWTAQLFK